MYMYITGKFHSSFQELILCPFFTEVYHLIYLFYSGNTQLLHITTILSSSVCTSYFNPRETSDWWKAGSEFTLLVIGETYFLYKLHYQ